MNNRLTTTNIGSNELKSLRQLAKKHDLSQTEFINRSILYFKKTGINPADEITSPREEINKLNNKMESVIKFIRTQEKTKMIPLLDELSIISRKLNDQMEDQLTLSRFMEVAKLFLENFKYLREVQENQGNHLKSIKNSVEGLPNSIRGINRLLYITKELHENLYYSLTNRSTMGRFRDEDIEKFSNTVERFNGMFKS